MFIKFMFKTEITGKSFQMTRQAFSDNEVCIQRPESRDREGRVRQPKYQSHVIQAPSGKKAVTEKVGQSKLLILRISNAVQHSQSFGTEKSRVTRRESTGRSPASRARGKGSTGQSKGSLLLCKKTKKNARRLGSKGSGELHTELQALAQRQVERHTAH